MRRPRREQLIRLESNHTRNAGRLGIDGIVQRTLGADCCSAAACRERDDHHDTDCLIGSTALAEDSQPQAWIGMAFGIGARCRDRLSSRCSQRDLQFVAMGNDFLGRCSIDCSVQ